MNRILFALLLVGTASHAEDRLLFDFERECEIREWSATGLVEGRKEPPPRVSGSEKHATSGEHSLEIAFDGGLWPGVVIPLPPDVGTGAEYKMLKADVTVSRPCLMGFRLRQEKSTKKSDDWERTAVLARGRNQVSISLHMPYFPLQAKLGRVTEFGIFMYKPDKGETVWVDNIRLDPQGEFCPEPSLLNPWYANGFSSAGAEEWSKTRTLPKFKVAGTDRVVQGLKDFKAELPPEATREDLESRFNARYGELQKEHPRALLVTFRDGENGYQGWKDSFISCHSPDGADSWRMSTSGKKSTLENFMRHRSVIMKVDLSTIPKGSTILAAQFLLTRTEGKKPAKPTMFVAEPCNRPWDEDTVNCYEYAPGKLWKAASGLYYGEDPDFHPIFLACGPSGWPVCSWDFTEAVRFWTDGKHENHGFFLHGDSGDYMTVHSREAGDVMKRPALRVVYEPPR